MTGETIFDYIFFTEKYQSRDGESHHTLACELQSQECSDFLSESTGNVYIFGYLVTYVVWELLPGYYYYNGYIKVISEIIK